jgi:sensor histidine kinase regulating citrate/malate metabolism
MPKKIRVPAILNPAAGTAEGITEVRRQGALQNAILNSANFSSIATDAKGVIQIFNVGAKQLFRGYPIPRDVALGEGEYLLESYS